MSSSGKTCIFSLILWWACLSLELTRARPLAPVCGVYLSSQHVGTRGKCPSRGRPACFVHVSILSIICCLTSARAWQREQGVPFACSHEACRGWGGLEQWGCWGRRGAGAWRGCTV